MQRLRTQVDRIDLEILKLLQQRTKLSRRIGETKRRHGAIVYVPERERELLQRVERLSRGKLPPRSVAAIYREILSSSRAAQGQDAIGLLRAGAAEMLAPARECLGTCSEFVALKSWPELTGALRRGSLTLALLSGTDLGRILRGSRWRDDFIERHSVVGDFTGRGRGLAHRIFIVTPRVKDVFAEATRVLILIECKSTANAVKSWIKSMPERSIEEEVLGTYRGVASSVLLRLSAARPVKVASIVDGLRKAGISFSLLGSYGGSEDHGG
jgi:chorismate mutase